MLSIFPALRRLLKKAKADRGTVEDMETLESALRAQERASPEAVTDEAIKKLRQQTESERQPDKYVDQYVTRLEAALGDQDNFKAVFEELRADAAIKRNEAIALAKGFAKETARSRDHALKLIMARHTALLGSRARQKATKGRTAA
jgi:phage anti-repressor protein